MDLRTAHDFSTENIILFILSGFIIVKTPTNYFVLNIAYKIFQLGLYAFLIVMAVHTMNIAHGDKILLVRAFYSLCLALVGVVFIFVKHFNDSSLMESTKLIKEGILTYKNEDLTESNEILATRIAQIRLANSAFKKLLISCSMVFIFISPLLQKLSAQDKSETLVNPYLPLPLYMPFNTTTYFGFISAFISLAVFYISLFLSALCSMMICISCAVQLIAHIEVLNTSLRGIEKRALLKFMKKNIAKDKMISENVYKKTGFQNCLYSCLRENILHHHAILRFKKAVCPFLETLNGICLLFFSATMAAAIFLILEGTDSDVTMVAFLLAETSCYLLISLVGQTITDKSNETAHSLYATPWPDCDEKFKLLLKIMATYLRHPITLKTTGFSGVSSLETFGDMMAAGYKLTSVLR